MPVASLVRVILAAERTAPEGSATRPRMRPLAPCAGSRVGRRREIATIVPRQIVPRHVVFRHIVFRHIVFRHIMDRRARSDGMGPPGILKRSFFFESYSLCAATTLL